MNDFRELDELPGKADRARWLLTLPAYRDTPDDEDGGDG